MSTPSFTGKPTHRAGILPVYILCDVSSSMGEPQDAKTKPLDAINAELASILRSIVRQGGMGRDIQLCVITFSTSAKVVLPLTEVGIRTKVPKLSASGVTNLQKGIATLATTIRNDFQRMQQDAYRPVVFIFTDGVATDEEGTPLTSHSSWKSELANLHEESAWNPRVYAYGFGEANHELLNDLVYERGIPTETLANRAQLSHETAVKSIERLFPNLFKTLTKAAGEVSNGASEDRVTQILDDAHASDAFSDAGPAVPFGHTIWKD